MDAGVFVPLLLPAAGWPLARLVSTVARPPVAVWLLTGSAVALAAGSTAALCVLAFAGLSLVPLVARIGEWSPQSLQGMEIASVPVEAGCGLALTVAAVSIVVTCVRRIRGLRALRRIVAGADGELVVVPGAGPVAFAAPVRGGRIVVSRPMLAALDPVQRRALLTHERVHLRRRHHLFLAATGSAAVLNPLLRPVRPAVEFLVERWADEETAERLGDRRVVAAAVAKAALVARGKAPEFAPAATGGPVPRRVAALLAPAPPRLGWRPVAALCAALSLVVTGWTAQASVEAAADLHAGLELASVGHHHHHPHALA
ncbi:M56 family metallopeptidase [Amycolatopsis sp.]|uniref:M56 family metallopeptidase n=1 Tax=Amycolatopsis sp. TaxID=37632 RepID=UPI002C4DD713|nr:M56 family metallopeptidase [Amycolatopsis sp.]HVV12269.1 M56 family metallopeptidase [Amycolatopsis sp.]